jgi:predicted adenine nucleotide alpha hydrolase (AANH) superfamily ATPase
MTIFNHKKKLKPGFLLHACCATCALHPYFLLSENFAVTLFFYNPNIHPEHEYKRRLKDVKIISKIYKIPLIIERYEVKKWFKLTKNLEKEPEGGKRCDVCFKMRLEKTATAAKKLNIGLFGTTLTISPHKNHIAINSIGKTIADSQNLIFYESNFKKKDGFKKTVRLSKSLSLYQQNYCGCIYSLQKKPTP